jgi:hypothetical protein
MDKPSVHIARFGFGGRQTAARSTTPRKRWLIPV